MPGFPILPVRSALVAILVAAGMFVGPSPLWSAPPTLSHLFPAGGQRGTRVEVQCTGSFSWPVDVWAPGLEIVPGKESGKLEVFIPKDLAADRVWIRLYNAEGASASAPFLIDNLKEINEQEPNDEPRTAQVLGDANVIINGILQKDGDVDGFAVNLKTGQTLVAAVDANTRLGSPMDAMLQVVTADGHVLAENNDYIHLDPLLAFTPTKSGTYVVRLFAFSSTPDTTIRFRGGDGFVYRLTLTTGPFITHAVPLTAPHTNPGTALVYGWNIPPKTKLPVQPFGGAKFADQLECEILSDMRIPAEARLGLVFAPKFARASRVRLSEFAGEQADAGKLKLLVPATSVTGWLRAPRQTDTYRVALKKGEQVVVSVETNSLNSPFDPAAKLTDSRGTLVASAEGIGPNREAMFTHVAARDGEYQLAVSDRFRHGGERFFYRLTVRLEESDFELSTATTAIVVAPHKPAELAIKVLRHPAKKGGQASVGPVAIEALALPPGVKAAAVVSEPTGPTAASVTLKFSTIGPGFSGPVRVVGKASQPRPLERFVRTPPRLGAAFETIWLTVIEKK